MSKHENFAIAKHYVTSRSFGYALYAYDAKTGQSEQIGLAARTKHERYWTCRPSNSHVELDDVPCGIGMDAKTAIKGFIEHLSADTRKRFGIRANMAVNLPNGDVGSWTVRLS